MITNFKIFENINQIENVRCNNCYSFFYDFYDGDQIEVNDYGEEVCPNCGAVDKFMDIQPFEIENFEEFEDYVKANKPKEGVVKSDYKDLEEYYKDAYPEFFEANKYNL